MHDRVLNEFFHDSIVKRVFRFVDDYLVILDCRLEAIHLEAPSILSQFSSVLNPLIVTHELPSNGCMRFLELGLYFTSNHVCWAFEPRANKPILPFDSAHSKLVKRSIIHSCFTSAIKKSCEHKLKNSFLNQKCRLVQAGYPITLLSSVAETMLRTDKTRARDKDKTCAVIPYVHGISHNLRKIGSRNGIHVLFSAPDRLSGLCKRVNQMGRTKVGCTTNHRDKFVSCTEGVVYSIPLSCGRTYVGQTGRCLNKRLLEHKYNVTVRISGHLGIHCRDCECAPQFNNTKVLRRSSDKVTREIMEAQNIVKLQDSCVSAPSIALLDKELAFLSGAR